MGYDKAYYDKYGTKLWKNEKGDLHRLDGPAIEYVNGVKVWYTNGQYHRLDGPAVEYGNGDKSWWIHDKYLTEDQFNNHPLVLQQQLLKELDNG